MALAALVLAAAAVLVDGSPARAVFADAVPASSGFTTRTIAPPTNLRCASILLLAGDLVWTASPDAASYTVTAPGGGTTVVAASTTSLHIGALSVGTWSVRANHASGWVSTPATVSVTQVLGVALCA